MERKKGVVIPPWFWKERRPMAEFCEMINVALETNPEMTLVEFAKLISDFNIEESYHRLVAIVNKQLEGEA